MFLMLLINLLCKFGRNVRFYQKIMRILMQKSRCKSKNRSGSRPFAIKQIVILEHLFTYIMWIYLNDKRPRETFVKRQVSK